MDCWLLLPIIKSRTLRRYLESGSFRSLVVSVWSFRPESFWPICVVVFFLDLIYLFRTLGKELWRNGCILSRLEFNGLNHLLGRRAGLVVRASDSGARDLRFNPHSGHRVVFLSKTHYLPKILVIHRKRWLRPNMTEKLFTGTLRIKSSNKPTKPLGIRIVYWWNTKITIPHQGLAEED